MLLQTLQDQYVKVGQINTRYRTLGDEGTTVILLHGLGGHLELWMDNIVALAQHHRVYAVDLVGFGRSDKPATSYSLSFLAQFLKDFMNALIIERASLIGCSMGGGVALQFALTFPEKLEKLVLISTIGLGKETALIFRLVAFPVIGELLTHSSRTGVTRSFKQVMYDPTLITEELVENTYQMSVLPGAKRALLSAVRTNAKYFGLSSNNSNPIVNKLTTIAAPTLIIWGQQDRIIPVSHAYVATKNLPNARLHIFERCGHWPSLEYSEEFNNRVLEFLVSD